MCWCSPAHFFEAAIALSKSARLKAPEVVLFCPDENAPRPCVLFILHDAMKIVASCTKARSTSGDLSDYIFFHQQEPQLAMLVVSFKNGGFARAD